MLQFLAPTLTKHLEPRSEITLASANCSVQGRIRTIGTQDREMRVYIDPMGQDLRGHLSNFEHQSASPGPCLISKIT